MTRRIVLGKRSNGDTGAFISYPGYDAFTALDANLLLSIHSKVSALLLMGYATSSKYVPLGFGAKPIVILNGLRSAFSINGLSKPSPFFYGLSPDRNYAYADMAPDGSGMSISTAYNTRYEVYNSAGV